MNRPQRLARKAEEETARRHGGRLTPMSGSGQAVKNDVRNTTWSFEVKSTSKLSYSARRDTLAQAAGNAMADGRRMAMVIEFESIPGAMPGYARSRYVLTTEDDFIEREQELHQVTDLWSAERTQLKDELREAERQAHDQDVEHARVIGHWVDRFGALREEADKLKKEVALLAAKIEADC